MLRDKSSLTVIVAIFSVVFSCFLTDFMHEMLFWGGLFALSGAVTNQLAIHMLFHKVPLLYGSGVIEKHFERFKASIKVLMVQEFFTREQIEIFLASEEQKIDLVPLVESADFSPAFDALSQTVMESKFGGAVAMFGGEEALEGLRTPFSNKLKGAVSGIVSSDVFKAQLHHHLSHASISDDFMQTIESMIDTRLNELTPRMVNSLVQTLIREHLGWLVVWGGVLGAVIGIVSSQLI